MKTPAISSSKLAAWLQLDHHMREVLQGATVAMILKVLSAGLSFGYNIVLARLLGAQGTGVYYLALTVTTIASVLGRVGLDHTLLRFTAASAVQEDWNRVADIYRKGIYLSTGASLAAMVVLYFSAQEIAARIFSEPELDQPLRVMALSIPFLSLLTLHGQLLKGLKKVGSALFIQGVGVSLIGLPILVVLCGTLGVKGAALAYVVATMLVFLLGAGLWRRAIPRVKHIRGTFDIHLLVRTSLPLLWAAIMMFVLNWIDTIMLGIWVESSSVGIYGATLRVARLTSFFLLAVSSIASPKLAALYEQRDMQGLKQVVQGTSKLVIVLSLPLVAIFLLAPRAVLGVFGPAFVAGATTLKVLSIGYFINSMAGVVSYLLMMTGNQQAVSKIMTVAALLNAGLNYLLIRPYGILGAGIATATTLIFTAVVFIRIVYKKMGFMPVMFPGLRTI